MRVGGRGEVTQKMRGLGQEARKEGNCGQELLLCFLQQRGKVDLGLTSLSNFREFWGIGTVSSSLALVSGVPRGGREWPRA